MKRNRHLLANLLLGALALLGRQAPANAAQFCVNTPADLQSALNTAAGNGVDDEVRIVQGTYVGNFVYASTQPNNLSVLGGFTAGCAGRELDPVNTILDGNQTDRVLMLSAPEVAAGFLVEGLTLRNGQLASGDGGGLFVGIGGTDGAVTVNGNEIKKNTASQGGGAYLSTTTTRLTNNNITGNTSESGGGGVHIDGFISGASAITATFTNNNITGNNSGIDGGGACIRGFYSDATTATFTNNNITGNTSMYGGGAYIEGDYYDGTTITATFTNNNITGNTTAVDGGGAYIYATTATLTNNNITSNTTHNWAGGAYIDAITATLTNNNITGNTTAVYGGGAYIYATTATLTNNSITGNTIIWGAGGGADLMAATATLTNNNISRNTATYGGVGGAEIHSFITATLTNNTLVGNAGVDGGGLWLNTGSTETTLSNNLFWANQTTGTDAPADLHIGNDGNHDNLPTPVTLLANNFDQSAAGFQSTLPIPLDPSNLDMADPLFVNQAGGNLRLTADSPMIDAGYPDTPNLPATDKAGGLRVVNGIVDIGAYEYHVYESCALEPLEFSAATFDAGGDYYSSVVSIATVGPVEILASADVMLRAPILRFGPGLRIETGAQFVALAGPVSCDP